MKKSLENLTFSEALNLLKAGKYNMMRYKNPKGSYEGNFIQYYDHEFCHMVGYNKYKPINMTLLTVEQLTEPVWHLSSPARPEGWFESAVDNTWYKPTSVSIWINVFYDYKTNRQESLVYWTEEEAKSSSKHKYFSDLAFIKTCHLQQQLSIAWRDV